MQQLSLIPVCEKHGVEKVWINDKSNRNGGFYRCRECNRERSLARNARNRINPAKVQQLNADARRRYHAQSQEAKDARNRQIVAQRVERLRRDPVARRAYNDYQNARRAGIPPEVHREKNLRKTYGIGQADYERMLAEQGGGCAICGSSTPNGRSRKYLHVDHCHTTGAVRGILCATCNSGLGSFGDDIGRLEAAVRYLSERKLGAVTQAA